MLPLFVRKFFSELFQNWIITEKGIAVVTSIWGVVMLILTAFTQGLSQYAPVSYFVAISIGMIMALHMARLANKVFERTTNMPTYIDYRMENGRINLVGKSNIYKEPSWQGLDVTVQPVPAPPINRHESRKLTKIAKSAPPEVLPPQQTFKSATILVIFDKPIKSATFHVQIEAGVGTCPVREASSIDNRWASITLANLADSCSFRIRFN